MNIARKRCIIPTPVHIGDAMFIGVGMPENGDNGKKSAISGVSEDATVPENKADETDR